MQRKYGLNSKRQEAEKLTLKKLKQNKEDDRIKKTQTLGIKIYEQIKFLCKKFDKK